MFDLTTHAVTEYAIPTFNSQPTIMAAGSDGNLWFNEGYLDQVGRFRLNPASPVSLPAATAGTAPTDVPTVVPLLPGETPSSPVEHLSLESVDRTRKGLTSLKLALAEARPGSDLASPPLRQARAGRDRCEAGGRPEAGHQAGALQRPHTHADDRSGPDLPGPLEIAIAGSAPKAGGASRPGALSIVVT